MQLDTICLTLCSIGLMHSSVATTLPAQERPVVAGTYRIAVCKVAPCAVDDTLRRVSWGTLVLGDTTFRVTTSGGRENRRLMAPYVRGTLNACYVMSMRERHAATYAGIGGVSTTTWSASGGTTPTVTVSLYSSPDAGYIATLRFSNGVLQGSGRSVGFGSSGVYASRDTIVAVRAGPPDYAPCLDAAAAPVQVPSSIAGMRNLLLDYPATVDPASRIAIVLSEEMRGGRSSNTGPPRMRSGGMWSPGTTMILPPWPSGDALRNYSDSVITRIRGFLAAGVQPANVTIVAGSGAGPIVAAVSSRLSERIGYVLLDGCSAAVRTASGGVLRGDVLSMLGSNASPDVSCVPVFNASPQPGIHVEVQVSAPSPIFRSPDTGDWVDLVADWIEFRKLGPPWRPRS